AANREFTRKHPVATKRALRAMLKATDLCVSQPERAARLMTERGVADKYEYVLQSVKEIGFRWREYESEDTVRFWALRLREAGIIKSSPNKIIAEGTDWRFFNELKRELKSWPMRAALAISGAMLVGLVLASLLLARQDGAPPRFSQQEPLPKIAPAPEFALISQDRALVSLGDYRGKVVAVTFILTLCTTLCPFLTPTMSFVQ